MADPRLQEALADLADGLLSADPGAVRMLTGHAGDIESGPSPFALPAFVLAPADGDALLVCSGDEAPQGDHVIAYDGFTMGPLDPVGNARRALADGLRRTDLQRQRVLVDMATLPVALGGMVERPVEAPEALALLRAVKTPAEVAEVEAALRVCEAGQAAARAAAAPGVAELEVWEAVRAAMEGAAGERLPVIADLVSGPRTGDVGGGPGGRRLERADVVLCDLVPRLAGMWGDSCATFVLGEPPVEAERRHRASLAALEAAVTALRPGAAAGEVDAAARAALGDAGYRCPHHIGHGVGFGWHEEPRIVPEATAVVHPGMVVALEPGCYGARIGVRMEQVAVVEHEGARVLSRHDLALGGGGHAS